MACCGRDPEGWERLNDKAGHFYGIIYIPAFYGSVSSIDMVVF
jgi:hypothetical protein